MSEIKEKILKVKEQKDTYIIPQNIKKDVKIFGVTGTYEGSSGVKLFGTQQEMQADENPQEGDLAVVYRSDIQSLTATAHFLKATFPETVVLNETLEDYVDLRFRTVDSSSWFDCWGMIDQNMFEMSCYGEQGQYRIQYESQDGLTYTRTRLQDPNGDVTGNELDFGVELYYEREEYWNDVIGKFILIGGNTFEGLFEYKPYNLDGTYCYAVDKSTKHYMDKPFLLPNFTTYQRVNERYGSDICNQYDALSLGITNYHLDESGLFYIIDKCRVFQNYGGNLSWMEYNGDWYARIWTHSKASYDSRYAVFIEDYDFNEENPVISSTQYSIFGDATDFSDFIYVGQNQYHTEDAMYCTPMPGSVYMRVADTAYIHYDTIPSDTNGTVVSLR